MAFNPSSTIYLCNVPIDSTYQHEIYFPSKASQQEYFSNKVVKTFSEYLTVRTTRPDGSLQSSVKVNANIDVLRSLPCNYMYYQNAHHGSRVFYAFITKMIYVNEGTTEIVFETDVYQTWLFDVQLMQSYVVREHSETDEIGDNIVPESFNFQNYTYSSAHYDPILDSYGYLIAATEHTFSDSSIWEELFGSANDVVVYGKKMSGIYQGLFFYFYKDEKRMNDFLNVLVERNPDCIVFIAVIPEFCVSANSIGATAADKANGEGWLYASSFTAEHVVEFSFDGLGKAFGSFYPKNNKLYTAPFTKLLVSNHNGGQAEYNIEEFADPNEIKFQMFGDVSANPTVTLFPRRYKGVTANYDCGISISGFPQVSLNTDTFKLWLAKNQYGVALDTAGNLGTMLAGIASLVAAPATGGASLAVGAGTVAMGAKGILSTLNATYQASREPNKSQSGGAKTNLLTAMGYNKFEYLWQHIHEHDARTVDDFFTMYGYQTNRVKVPNVSSRPYFNYVQTVDVNIVGGIPSDDMLRLKQIYNAGVTLWKANATVGDYSVDNSP